MRGCGDVERAAQRLCLGRGSPRDLNLLAKAIEAACRLRELLSSNGSVQSGRAANWEETFFGMSPPKGEGLLFRDSVDVQPPDLETEETKASLGGRPSQGGSMGRTFQWQPIKFPVYK